MSLAEQSTTTRSCASCGRGAEWLVAVTTHGDGPGRLLLSCDDCRDGNTDRLVLVVPLHAFDVDPLSWLASLYRSGVTQSDPDVVAEALGVPRGAWSHLMKTPGPDQSPTTDAATLAAPFAVAIHAKVIGWRSGAFPVVAGRRLKESIGVDLRKCSDLLTPWVVPYLISTEAAARAAAMGVDLARETWHRQAAFDPGRKVFHYEHFHTIADTTRHCLAASTAHEILEILIGRLRIAWITKGQDVLLRTAGYTSFRPDPEAAYEAVGISLHAPQPVGQE